MYQRRFRLDIKKNFSSQSGQALEWLPREVVKSPSLAVFKRRLDEELRDVVWWLVVAMVMGGRLDYMIL